MDGNLEVAYDISTNFVTAWNQMFVDNDFLNPNTGKVDPKHMFGTSNFDVFRWPSLENGTERSVLATFITSLVMPGIPLVSSFSLYLVIRLIHQLLVVLWRGTEFVPVRHDSRQLSLWVSVAVSSLLNFFSEILLDVKL